MLEVFPEAEAFCLWNDDPARFSPERVQESWLAKSFLRRNKALAIAPMLPTWRRVRAGPYKWALVSSHLFAHHVSFKDPPEGFQKLVYVHTPARYIWQKDLDSRGTGRVACLVSPLLRDIDRRRAQEAAALAANSSFIQKRIERCWGRTSQVIYPPVKVELIQSKQGWGHFSSVREQLQLAILPAGFLLGASRFVKYKRLEQVIDAGAACDLPVVIAGTGPEEKALRQRALDLGVNATFILSPSDPMLYELYSRALAYIFPPVEDFGIMAVEAMACGTPVIVNSDGGAAESIPANVGCSAISKFDHDSMRMAVRAATGASRNEIAAHARRFSTATFESALRSWVESSLISSGRKLSVTNGG